MKTLMIRSVLGLSMLFTLATATKLAEAQVVVKVGPTHHRYYHNHHYYHHVYYSHGHRYYR